MPKISKIQPIQPRFIQRKRVAAYARVSKDSERLLHSLSAQVSYYSSLIQKNPEWVYAGVYCDEGITGTIAEKRDGFNRLIADCDAGKIDMVIVKAISRFARNTVDLLETVRHLKDIGVAVWFEREKINSMSDDGELMLTLLASFAQEESRSMSDNIKWSFQKKYEKGQPHFHFRILGYVWEGDTMVIDEDEAQIVRRIFGEYLNGKKLIPLAETLTKDGYYSINGNPFQCGTIYKILTNITYTGNFLCQKTYIEDPITKVSKVNNGELPQYYIENSHEAIIDMETFERVQAEMDRRRELGVLNCENLGINCFSAKIKCERCGRSFNRRRTQTHSDGTRTRYWVCNGKKSGICDNNKQIPETILLRLCCNVLELDAFEEDEFNAKVEQITVPGAGKVIFHMKDGRTIPMEWQSNLRHESWDKRRKANMTKKMQAYHAKGTAFGTMIICENCGEPLRKYMEKYRGKRVNFWRCTSEKNGCRQRGIREDFLKETLTEVLEWESFSEEKLNATVECMTFSTNRVLTIKTKKGKIIKIKLGGTNNGYSYEDTCDIK
ncbi:MAG: recombinase family protein [Hespellia sp.]|nr:recombinase family protein [Hespellia sp.]